MSWRERHGPWAIVTGASSGIGEELAKAIAGRGVNVVLVARRRDRLEALAAALPTESRIVELDLAREDSCAALIAATRDLEVGLLVANAGFGLKGDFLRIDLVEQRRMLAVNCRSPLELAHTFLPAMVARGRGGVIFTSSTAAFQGLPTSAAYGATKGFTLLLAEGLREELRGSGVEVLALCPGPTDTEGPRRTGVDPAKVSMMTAAAVADAGVRQLGKTGLAIPGFTNRLAVGLGRFLPRALVSRVAGTLMRRAMTKE